MVAYGLVPGPVTLLFTDLVNSTALLERVGDEQAQRVLRAHRQLLREAIVDHGGQEAKWLGDGLLATFVSVAEAVRCAVTMQQAARAASAGERLGLRIGLHVGEVLAEEDDFVGTPVVLARRLCDQAAGGQTLCSGVVVELLRGRRAFRFEPVGALALKGFAEPVAAFAVGAPDDGSALALRPLPFAGRTAEWRQLVGRLDEARAGRGGVVLLAGEPGIGKTRMMAELADQARAQGALVLAGRCYEGEAGRAYGPFAEAIGDYVRTAAPEGLRADLGLGAAPLTRLVPGLRERLAELAEPVALDPFEERVRLLDAVAQFLLALAARVTTVLVLDDLHWADPSTVGLLRHVARFASRGRLLVVGAYRAEEVARDHPLTDALGTLPRETSYAHVGLGGLEPAAVRTLVESVAPHAVAGEWSDTLARETSGNPFFIREVLLHLVQEGRLPSADGRAARRLAVPETVRQVIGRRLERLSVPARQLLQAAAGCTAGIELEVVRRVAGLAEGAALDALDESMAAQLLVAPVGGEHYEFAHALVRHALYEALSPARQVRLHRTLAEAMEAVWGARAGAHAGEIAEHYGRSRSLPGAERGADHAITAAERTEAVGAHDEAARFWRMALHLLPPGDDRRASTLAHLSLALTWALDFDEARRVAIEAAASMANAAGRDAAADYLAAVVLALNDAGAHAYVGPCPVVRRGLDYAGDRRDLTWATLKAIDIIDREIADPDSPGMLLDTPERREVAAVFEEQSATTQAAALGFASWRSRAEIVARSASPAREFSVGDYRRGVMLFRRDAADSERLGRINRALLEWATIARFHTALGEFAAARAAYRHAEELAGRLPEPSTSIVHLLAADDEWRLVRDEGWNDPTRTVGSDVGDSPVFAWHRASLLASFARTHAHRGRVAAAMRRLESVLPAVERAPGWAENYVRTVCDAAATLWLTRRTNFAEQIERNVRAKVVEPDLRYPMMDGRQALGRLCALQGRLDEARRWFAKARTVLDEQDARPLRAIIDYDEALMYVRRGARGDRERAEPLLAAALAQFRALGMPGWLRRAETLHATGVEWTPGVDAADGPAPTTEAIGRAAAGTASTRSPDVPGAAAASPSVWRREGDVFRIEYAGRRFQLRHHRGLVFLARLLAQPGVETAAVDLVGDGREAAARALRPEPDLAVHGPGDAGEHLDAAARAAYRRRLADVGAELAEAEAHHDLGRLERLRAEQEFLGAELRRAVGLGGRARRAGSPAERARINVTRAIGQTLERIARHSPELARHLRETVRTGTICVYRPDSRLPIAWET